MLSLNSPWASSLFLFYLQTTFAVILLASNPLQATIPKTFARGSRGSVYLKEERFSVYMTAIPKGRKRKFHKLQARGVIFALNHLEEVIKGNVIPHLNFFSPWSFHYSFLMRGALPALEEEEEDVSGAEGVGGGVKIVHFSVVLTWTAFVWITSL